MRSTLQQATLKQTQKKASGDITTAYKTAPQPSTCESTEQLERLNNKKKRI